ncbi:MAG: rod shape-determining protein RodA [Alphaproteobacteria bacterium]
MSQLGIQFRRNTKRSFDRFDAGDTIWTRIWRLHWVLLLLITAVAGFGIAILYSAADGSWQPWAGRQLLRFGLGFGLLLVIGLTNLQFWWRMAYPIYLAALALLLVVEFIGVGDGATRWINLGFMNLQPSEVMKVALVLALARYFHDLDENQVDRFIVLVVPAFLTAIPVMLVLRQPDLGTAIILLMLAVAAVFLGGLAWWKFAFAGAVAGGAAPLAWTLLHDYQQDRVLTFLEPERDPLGAGYHIVQSKIALGSGGPFGKGFMEGSQSQLSFLPEKHTDFIFTMMAEEFGFFGSVFLLSLYAMILFYCFLIGLRTNSVFARLLTIGMAFNLFLYAFINMAMVMGLMPVVGVPLPLISYGGTAMLTLLIGFGLVQSVSVHGWRRIGSSFGRD